MEKKNNKNLNIKIYQHKPCLICYYFEPYNNSDKGKCHRNMITEQNIYDITYANLTCDNWSYRDNLT